MRIDAFFFDFDGTIGDTGIDIRAAWQAAIRKQGLTCEKFDRIFRVGPPVYDTAAMLFPGMPEYELQQLVTAYKSFYDEAVSYKALPYPEILETLNKLVRNGKKIYIVTNKRIKPLVKLVRQFGLTNLCHGVFAPDIIDPHHHLNKTELLAFALKISAVSPEHCLMVGDTELDIQAAHANNIAACGVTWGYGPKVLLEEAKPLLIIDTPLALLN